MAPNPTQHSPAPQHMTLGLIETELVSREAQYRQTDDPDAKTAIYDRIQALRRQRALLPRRTDTNAQRSEDPDADVTLGEYLVRHRADTFTSAVEELSGMQLLERLGGDHERRYLLRRPVRVGEIASGYTEIRVNKLPRGRVGWIHMFVNA